MRLARFTYFDKTAYVVLGPVLHKCLEVGGGLTNRRTVEFEVRFRSTGDHAGLHCYLQLWRLLGEFNVTDHRHWNHEKGRFYLPGEEPVFEGYPHE